MLDLLLEYESASDRSADLERICESMTTRTGVRVRARRVQTTRKGTKTAQRLDKA